MSLYEEMQAAGLVVGNRYSDLHVKDTPEAWAIFEKYADRHARPQRFVSLLGEGPCLDIPFAYIPYWDEVNEKIERRRAAKGVDTSPEV
jgi:hypothetical protein